MKFKFDVMRAAVTAGLAVMLLASCGGGTQIEAFSPRRVIAFGDESSLIEVDPTHPDQGRKYTVNGVQFFSDTSVDPAVTKPVVPTTPVCSSNQIWVQQLAASYGFAFPPCASSGVVVNSEMRAVVGATAASIQGQVDDFTAGNPFSSNDLVALMVGVNDIIGLYQSQVDPTSNSSALIAAAQQAGTEVGSQVVRITDRGAKVLVSTIPNVGLMPFAINEEAAHPGEGRLALLSLMSEQFNTRLRLKLQDVRDGGRAVGLILGDELVLAMTNFPGTYGLSNITQAACVTTSTALLPTCDQTNLDPLAQLSYGGEWLWADDRHLGAAAQSRLGTIAASRARTNPF